MCELVARTGRQQQRYEDGCRLVAGCIPFKYKTNEEIHGDNPKKVTEVLMINSQSGPGLLFPKGGWENDETVEEAAVREAIEEAGVRGDLKEFLGHYDFRSKSHQDEFSPEGLCKAAMFALHVKEELDSWPEQSTRNRKWLTIPEAAKLCRYPWMREALFKFSDYHDGADIDGNGVTTPDDEGVLSSENSSPLSR
ncbi:putative nudix hydrolase 16, mitochondrial [Iris pallida]|uniref:Nudix hydrolase 16, mitochondrial n=1 Tax=Iris pallida TaxID=29817 RepID=A0AAX6EL61_IRIPA|nr:putative nudix hydrolase 16, mitochondrial [Iris pallida]